VRRTATLLLLAAAGWALAACGGGDGSGSQLDACALLPQPDVAEATGYRVLTAGPGSHTKTEKWFSSSTGQTRTSTSTVDDTGTCHYVLDGGRIDKPSDITLLTVVVGRVAPSEVPGIFATADDAADLDASLSDLGEVRKKRIGELGDRAALYTWTKGVSFRIVAARGGDVVAMDGQNVKEKAGEKLVREVLVALEQTGTRTAG
jgi:hypothetical protein